MFCFSKNRNCDIRTVIRISDYKQLCINYQKINSFTITKTVHEQNVEKGDRLLFLPNKGTVQDRTLGKKPHLSSDYEKMYLSQIKLAWKSQGRSFHWPS